MTDKIKETEEQADVIDTEVVDELTEEDVADVDVPFEVPAGYRVMTDEEAELLAQSLVESHQEKWEIQEVCDDLVLAGQTHEMLRNEFMYEFTQGGKTIRGLTAPMIKHLAARYGLSEVTEERVYNGEDEKSEFDVVVEMVNPRDKMHKQKMSGFAEEPKMKNGKYNKFHKQTAHSKAFRNAALGLLPADLIQATIFKLSRIIPVDFQPRQSATNMRTTENARKACFAVYGKHEAHIKDTHNVDRTEFGNAIKKHFDVKSRKDMTANQWGELRKSLETEGYGNIVMNIIKIAKADSVDTLDDNGIPF